MVADEVIIFSKKAGESQTYFWRSKGKEEYTVGKSKNEISHGTKIILKIKNSEQEFLDYSKIKKIVTTYSNHISWPIQIVKNSEKELINNRRALWTNNPSNVKNDEYQRFYNNILNIQGSPWLVMHNRIEGIIEYTNLLVMPEEKAAIFSNNNKHTKLKLYSNKVLISNEYDNLLPNYLRFVVGIIDSKDLNLNISRETLQNNNSISIIKRSLTRRILESVKKQLNNLKVNKKYLMKILVTF
jgi:molecular chaperone HtpG